MSELLIKLSREESSHSIFGNQIYRRILHSYLNELLGISREFNKVKNSRSLKITKPLRKSKHLIELFKTQGIETTLKNIFYKLIGK